MGRHTVDVVVDSAAGPETVWRLLADVTTWPAWTRFDEAAYEQPGTPAPHGLGAVRRLRAGRLRSRETVLRFEPPSAFSYDYVDSLPVRGYRADVTLSARPGGTRIEWHADFEPTVPLTVPLMRLLLGKVLGEVAGGLARAAERATPQQTASPD